MANIKIYPRTTLVALALIGLLLNVSACGANRTNSPVVQATPTPAPDLAATTQALSTNIAVNAGIVSTSAALSTESAMRPTRTPTITPTHAPPTPTGTLLVPPVINVPQDIPLPVGELRNLFTSNKLISFLIQTDFNQLVTFYDSKMVQNGWTKVDAGSYLTNGAALLNYSKTDRNVSISLRFNPITNLTAVVITIQ